MDAAHYTLELYNVSQAVLKSKERYEEAHKVPVRANWFELYYHGTNCIDIHSRALRTIDVLDVKKVTRAPHLVCWKPLESVANYDPKHESLLKLLERILSIEEKAMLAQKLRKVLKDDASDEAIRQSIPDWQKCGLYEKEMGELPLLLLQRNRIRAAGRSESAFIPKETDLPRKHFSITSRIWVEPTFCDLVKKIASLISHMNSRYVTMVSEAKYSGKNAPTLQLSRTYETCKGYIDAVKMDADDFYIDMTLDLCVNVLATKHIRSCFYQGGSGP